MAHRGSRRSTSSVATALLAASIGLAGCGDDGDGDRPDASCSMAVELGTGSHSDFAPFAEGQRVEVIRGFQGFRMLRLTLRLAEPDVAQAEVSMHLALDDGALDVDQRNDHVPASPGPRESYVEGYLLFFNDLPASTFVDRTASLEVVARARCTGTLRRTIVLADDEPCIDTTTVVPDASVEDIHIPDGAVACP